MRDNDPYSVEPRVLYLAAEIRRRLHLGDWAWRKLRRRGLPIIRFGRQAYVLGDDVIATFQSLHREEPRS